MYANGNILHDGQLIKHGEKIDAKKYGIDKDQMDALIDVGAAVEDEPEPNTDISGVHMLEVSAKNSAAQASKAEAAKE